MKTGSVIPAVLVAVTVTLAGVVWQLFALEVYSARAGVGVRGLISNPRPLDYSHYEYTPNGRHIEFWSLRVPAGVTIACLGVVAIACTFLLRRRSERGAAIVWIVVLICIVLLVASTAAQYLIATNVFI